MRDALHLGAERVGPEVLLPPLPFILALLASSAHHAPRRSKHASVRPEQGWPLSRAQATDGSLPVTLGPRALPQPRSGIAHGYVAMPAPTTGQPSFPPSWRRARPDRLVRWSETINEFPRGGFRAPRGKGQVSVDRNPRSGSGPYITRSASEPPPWPAVSQSYACEVQTTLSSYRRVGPERASATHTPSDVSRLIALRQAKTRARVPTGGPSVWSRS